VRKSPQFQTAVPILSSVVWFGVAATLGKGCVWAKVMLNHSDIILANERQH
jgi:hypothetical protein